MNNSNKTINSLWIGNELENLELLTLHSFIAHGHIFQLWTYSKDFKNLPKGVVLCDANKIIPQDKIFKYKYGGKKGLGKGSYAGFADIFRFKLLYEIGGWWVDMDVTCLKAFDFEEEYVFRNHDYFLCANNVMKCPPKSPFMKLCYEETDKLINEENRIWAKPSEILSNNLIKFGLTKYLKKNMINPDRWELVELYKNYSFKINSNFYAIHWMNEEWRRANTKKNEAKKNSLYEKMLINYGLDFKETEESSKRFRFFYLIGRLNLILVLRAWTKMRFYSS
ncbi:MAG TPA: hypothetical protein ENI82_03500 [Bacteroidetes bacterium]|nr:hypothetical protein [Bacteroidota bacterium]